MTADRERLAELRREEARTISRLLASRMASLVDDLRLTGRRDGHQFVALNPTRHDRSLGSFRIELSGPKAGRWNDYATEEYGDALSLVAYVNFRGQLREAIAWSKSFLGLPLEGPVPEKVVRELPPPPTAAEREAAADERRAKALKIWLAGEADLRGSPVAAYLAGRGLDLAQLGRQPRALRYHPKLWNVESGRFWPAMVAAITDADGKHIATHRTWIAEEGGRWRKAPLEDAKRTLGAYVGGSIRIWRGASGKNLRDAPEGDRVAIAEGIETSLSVALAAPELRVLCAVSLSNMRNLALPPAVGMVVICGDNDPQEGRGAVQRHNLMARTIAHFREGCRDVRLAVPSVPGADWNDIAQGVEG